MDFLNFVLRNKQFHSEKNIIIYLSGCQQFAINWFLRNELEVLQAKSSCPKKSKSVIAFELLSQSLRDYLALHHPDIKHIQLIEKCDDGYEISETFIIHPEGYREISIYRGFYLDNECYPKLYQQAPIAGVSGDNTFELAVSCRVFPFYLSTNHTTKCETLAALADIISWRDLPQSVKNDYLMLFREMGSWRTVGHIDHAATIISTKFSDLNLPEMIAYWPRVADYLIANHNFYDYLETIFLEDTFELQRRALSM